MRNGGDKLRQGGTWIAKNRDIGGVIFAELPGVGIEVNDAQPRRKRINLAGKRQREQITTDRQQQIVVRHDVTNLRR